MFAKIARLSACALLVLALPAQAGSARVFAQRVTANAKEIVSYPVGNPSAIAVVGPQADTLTGLDFDEAAAVLWAIDFTTQQIGTVDQSTAAFTPSALLQGPCCFTSFTIDPVSGIFYGARGDNEDIYSIDPLSGQSTLQQAAAAPGWTINALTIDCDGRGIASAVDSQGSERLYQWHVNGNVTLVGDTGYTHATSLDFDNADGRLYGWFGTTDASTHVTIDPANAQTSQPSVLAGRYRMAVRSACAFDRIFTDGFDPLA